MRNIDWMREMLLTQYNNNIGGTNIAKGEIAVNHTVCVILLWKHVDLIVPIDLNSIRK